MLSACSVFGCREVALVRGRCATHAEGRAVPCQVRACTEVATYRGRCALHARELEQARGSSSRRGYDSRWQGVRRQVLARQPRCTCGAPSVDVHHVLPRRRGGPDTLANLVALCHRCHARLTRAGR